MKIKSSILRKLVKEVLSEVNIVKFNQDEMGELHKGFVRVVEKKTKTAWGWGTRKDVVISWKKAYASYQS